MVGVLPWLAAGCPVDQGGSHSATGTAALHPRALVSTLATYDQLGSAWEQLEGARSIYDISATADAQRALIRLRGWGGPAIWFADNTFTQTQLGFDPVFVDPAQGLTYKITEEAEGPTNRLSGYKLPRRELTVTHEVPRGRLLALSAQPDEQCAWFAIRRDAEGPRAATIEIGWFNPQQLFGITLKLPDQAPLPDHVRLVPLAAGGALVEAAGVLYHVDRAGTQQRLEYALPAEREYLLAADSANARVFWLHLAPVTASLSEATAPDGNPKQAIAERQPGELLAVDLDGGELGRLATGVAAFSQIAGDWDQQRALLAQKHTGVVLADFAQHQLSWLLRQDADTPAYLLPGGQVWAFTGDRIVDIGADELIELAPKLSAAEMLSRNQAEELRPVTDALGWNWSEIQVSPLAGTEGEMAFFDTGDLAASLAEFVWNIEDQRVVRLHLTRTPTAADRELLAQSTDTVEAPARQLINVLGWPDAGWLADAGFSADDELKVLYELKPGQRPEGIFTLWITTGATYMQLDSDGTFEPEPPPEPAVHDESSHMEGDLQDEESGSPAPDNNEAGEDATQ